MANVTILEEATYEIVDAGDFSSIYEGLQWLRDNAEHYANDAKFCIVNWTEQEARFCQVKHTKMYEVV